MTAAGKRKFRLDVLRLQFARSTSGDSRQKFADSISTISRTTSHFSSTMLFVAARIGRSDGWVLAHQNMPSIFPSSMS